MAAMDSAFGAIIFGLCVILAAYPLGFVAGLIIGLTRMAAMSVARFWNDDTNAPRRSGARRLAPTDPPVVAEIAEELARRAGIPVPALYLIDSTETNAVALGRDRSHAAICITTGLLQVLTRDELAGVMAHEFGHVLHYCSAVKTSVSLISAAAALLAPASVLFGVSFKLAALLTLVTPFAAILLRFTVSRAQEYSADACGARLTGRPDVMIDVLSRFELAEDHGPDEPVFAAVVRGVCDLAQRLFGAKDILHFTHPLLKNRIAALRRLYPGLLLPGS